MLTLQYSFISKILLSLCLNSFLLLPDYTIIADTLTCKRIRDAALSTFIHHYTFAAKSKSIKYDSRRTI